MSVKDYKSNEEIRIIISKDAGRKKAGPARGAVDQSGRPLDYLPRRAAAGVGITFYDLNQFKNEAGAYVDRSISADLTTDNETLVDFVNAPLDADAGLWAGIYRQVTKADARKYLFSVRLNGGAWQTLDAANPNVLPSGALKYEDEINRFRLDSFGSGEKYVFYNQLFQAFDTNAADLKITGTADFAGPAVPFSILPGAPAECFLNVNIFSIAGQDVRFQDVAPVESTNTLLSLSVCGWTFVRFPIGVSSYEEQARENKRIFRETSDVDSLKTKIINWRRGQVFPLYTEKDTPEEADAQASQVLISNYAATAQTVNRAGYGIPIYQALHTLPNGDLLYPYFRGTWKGMSDPPNTIFLDGSNPVGTETVTPLAAYLGTYSVNSLSKFGMLKAAFHQNGNWFFIWQSVNGGSS